MVYMTNFEKAVDFNKLFGVTVKDSVYEQVFTEDPKLVSLRYALIDEEVKELTEAIEQHDLVEVVDALADILYVVYGAGASFGVNLDERFNNYLKKTFHNRHNKNQSNFNNYEE